MKRTHRSLVQVLDYSCFITIRINASNSVSLDLAYRKKRCFMAQCRFEWNFTSRTLPFLLHRRLAGRSSNGVFGAVKGGQSPAQRTLDGTEKAFTLKGLGLDAGLASGPRARPAARTSPPSRAGVGAGEFTRFGSSTFPPPRKVPLETTLSLFYSPRQKN